MDTHDIAELERRLATPDDRLTGGPDLAGIRRRGLRRRRGRRALVAGGSALAVLTVVGATTLGLPGGDPRSGSLDRDDLVGTAPTAEPTAEPTRMTPVAERALSDIDGARKVSDWQVVLPSGGAVEEMAEPIDPADVVGEPVPLGTGAYTGVTMFPRSAFPGWLYEGVARFEEQELGDEDGSYPVGSTEMGVIVDWADAELACLAPRTSGGEDMPGDTCHPTVLARAGDAAYLQWGMGTEDFLEPGTGMELFTADDFRGPSPSTVWIGGLDGTGVDRVDFVTTGGEVVEGTVLAGTLVPGDTMFFANVPEDDLARVVAYDASGEVVDEHDVEPCSGGVDCEVR